MPILPLVSLPSNQPVFIDANVLVYGLNAQSPQCREFILRCSRAEVFGVTSFEVINEALHRLMLAEAASGGFISKPIARELRRKPDLVPRLTAYWRRMEPVLRMEILFIAANEQLVREAQTVRSITGLLTNDSMIVACMRHYGISQIASNDEDFGAITGITVFRPDDVT